MDFPKGFLWGASTASYQIEGGNSRSALWDWEVKRGWERSGEAARSWDLFEEDLKLLKALNLNAYRFSVEWSRVETAPGVFDEEAILRYVHWAKRLKEEGIRPFLCFHHFSEPAWLLREHPKGWLDPDVPKRFLAYVQKTAPLFTQHVEDWVTFNEPMVFLVGAYGFPMFPPGRRLLFNVHKEFNPVLVPNMAGAHRDAYRYLHGLQPQASVGIAHNIYALEPARPGDERAVEAWDWFMHRHFLDLIKDEQDYLGINYYSRIFVSRHPGPSCVAMGAFPGYAEIEHDLFPFVFKLLGGRRDGKPRTGMGWEVVPEAFCPVVLRYAQDYKKPVYITENGMAASPEITREQYLRGHLSSLAQAVRDGADVRGYFHWSLMDNYEWGSYRPRFGLFTRQRQKSNGADYYARVAKTGLLDG